MMFLVLACVQPSPISIGTGSAGGHDTGDENGDATGTHDYGIEWTADAVTFTMDGAPAASFTTAVPAGNLAVHCNHWTTDAWDDVGGPPAANDLHCLVDWVAGG